MGVEGGAEASGLDAGGSQSRGVYHSKQEWAYALNNNDWPSENSQLGLSKREFYTMLRQMPAVYDKAVEDLANDPFGMDLTATGPEVDG